MDNYELLTYLLSQVAQKASRERHCCRTAARLVMVFHVRPHSFISFSTFRFHLSFGRPLLFLSSAVQRKAVLGSASGDILHLLLLICVAKDAASVLRSSSSLVMVLDQNTPRIFRRHMFWKASIIIGTKQQRNRVINHFPVKLLGSDTFPSYTVCNLGVVFDSDFNFRQHISQVRKSCFYHIRDLRQIRRRISMSTAKTISTALISSRLDYCIPLLNDIAKRDLAKLQRVQNCLARVVLSFHYHYHYLNSHTGFQFLIELMLSCPLLHTVLYIHNNQPTWLVSCIFQISPGSSDHQFHNLSCLKQNLTWVNVLSLSLRVGSGMNYPSL